MFSKNEHPQNQQGLDTQFDFRDEMFDGFILSHRDKKKQHKTGNRCGHHPKKPRFYVSPTHHKRKPHSIEEAKRRLYGAYANPFSLPLIELFYHKDKNGRRRRSEIMEAIIVRVLACLWDNLCLHAKQLGFYDNQNNFHAHGLAFISKITGASETQVSRVIRILKDTNYIDVKEIKEFKSNGFRTKEVLITALPKFFTSLNLNENQLLSDMETATAKYNAKQARKEAKMQKLIDQLQNRKNKIIKKEKNNPQNKIMLPSETSAQNKTFLQLAKKLYDENPSINITDYLKLIITENRPPN